MGSLYKLTSPSGKSYIGISLKGVDARWAKHVEHAMGKRSAGALYAALRKYGPDTFTRTLLAEEDDWTTLRAMEITAIREHQTLAPIGYNITQGGEGTRTRLSAEAKANISAAQKARFRRPEERARLRAFAEIGRKVRSERYRVEREERKPEQDERKRKQAEYVQSPEFKALASKAIRDGLAAPEVRAKVLACAKQRSESPHWRARISASKTGKKVAPCSEQRKQRIAEARRREWADPVIRERRLAAFAKARAEKGINGSSGKG